MRPTMSDEGLGAPPKRGVAPCGYFGVQGKRRGPYGPALSSRNSRFGVWFQKSVAAAVRRL